MFERDLQNALNPFDPQEAVQVDYRISMAIQDGYELTVDEERMRMSLWRKQEEALTANSRVRYGQE